MGAPPPTVCSIRVAQQVQSLGVTYNSDSTTPPPPARSWEDMLDTTHAGFTKPPMFGRATAASSYCISKLLFQAEFDNMPDTVASELQR